VQVQLPTIISNSQTRNSYETNSSLDCFYIIIIQQTLQYSRKPKFSMLFLMVCGDKSQISLFLSLLITSIKNIIYITNVLWIINKINIPFYLFVSGLGNEKSNVTQIYNWFWN